jgi:hypothetical protein
MIEDQSMNKLALLGGIKAVHTDPVDIFDWPLVTPEVEAAVLEVLRAGKMSGTDVTQAFEREFAAWHGMQYALAHSSGTASLQGAMFGLGIGHGDEIICPSITYWASCLPIYALGGTVVFADIDPQTLCIDPNDIEHRISERTKAIVVVHYGAHPADMDTILALARRYGIAVIEDPSHAHGALFKGKLVGTMGDVAGFSLMSGKSLACGEGGVMMTNDRRIYERALLFGHYARHNQITLPTYVGDGSRAARTVSGTDGRDRSGDELFWRSVGGHSRHAGASPTQGFRADDGRLVRALGPLSLGRVGRPFHLALLRGCAGGRRPLHAGMQQGLAPAPIAQHCRRLRAGTADADRQLAGGGGCTAASGKLARRRGNPAQGIPHSLVQALPSASDRAVRGCFWQGSSEPPGSLGR